jgi:hypothetical protein
MEMDFRTKLTQQILKSDISEVGELNIKQEQWRPGLPDEK